jgi:processive 1,2-diacylglycerol beta-glucosyltransferase
MEKRPRASPPRILILTLSHGASHRRASNALAKALLELQPQAEVRVEDALERTARWFRMYYNSYEIPLKYFPSFWAWIESIQHRSDSTGPGWLYRAGAKPLFRYIEEFHPDVVVATEVGIAEFTAMHRRQGRARYLLVGIVLMDFNRAWVPPEIDLYPSVPGEMAAALQVAGVPEERILPCGLPIDPVFAALPEREATRRRLGIEAGVPMALGLFGGGGHGSPARIIGELQKVRQPLAAIFVAGKNRRLEEAIRRRCAEIPRFRTLGWVENMHEWMVAADLLLSKPGGSTLMEGLACGLPMLAFDPLPGNERRTALQIEKWKVGLWIRKPEDISPTIERLLAHPEELAELQRTARALARPHAAHDAAKAILERWEKGA